MRLILVRHGQTHSNVGGLLDTGYPGAELTDLGHQQAQALVDLLADQPIGAIVVSNLVRTHQTAAPLAAARGLTPLEREGIREVRAGDWEMSGDHEPNDLYRRMIQDWAAGRHEPAVPGGEEALAVLDRFDTVVAEVEALAAAEGHEAVVLVSHGAMIRFWATARAENLDADFTAANLLANTAVVVMERRGDGWVAHRWADQRDLLPGD